MKWSKDMDIKVMELQAKSTGRCGAFKQRSKRRLLHVLLTTCHLSLQPHSHYHVTNGFPWQGHVSQAVNHPRGVQLFEVFARAQPAPRFKGSCLRRSSKVDILPFPRSAPLFRVFCIERY